MTAVGIDLGTSFSCVAIAPAGKLVVIPDAEGRTVHPSVVHYPARGNPVVGWAAKTHQVTAPHSTVFSAKRLVGRRFDDPEVRSAQYYLPYKISRGPNDLAVIEVSGQTLTVPQVQADILRHLKALAEAYLKQRVTDAVITVPANFNHAQRAATQLAGKLAGLNVLRILNEPTAAALSYGMGRGYNKTLAIYDFGGGTFDFTLLDLQDQIFRTVATAGDTFLGGDDFDLLIAEEAIRQFERKHKINLQHDVVEWQRVLAQAERTKRKLTELDELELVVENVAQRAQGPIDLKVSLNRWQANWMWRDLVGRSLAVLDQAFGDAQRAPTDVHEVLLVGGSSLIPFVRRAVEQYFRRRPRSDLDPLTAVALGAALQAHALSSPPTVDVRSTATLLLDVVPLTIGIAAAGGQMEPIIPRNQALPVEKTRRFATSRDNQPEVRIKVYQGEKPAYEENTYLGEMAMDKLRPAPAGEIEIDVTFEMDTDGILSITARDLDSGRVERRQVRLGGQDIDWESDE